MSSVVLATLVLVIAPVASAQTVTIPGTIDFETVSQGPGTNRCNYEYFIQFPDTAGVVLYSASLDDNAYLGHRTFSGPPFQDAADGFAPAAPAGMHRFSLTGGSGPDPCTDSYRGRFSNLMVTGTLATTTAPVITSPNAATFDEGVAGSFNVTTAGSPTPAITMNGTLPSGVSFTDNGNGTATLAGAPSAGTGGTYDLVVTAANGTSPDATQALTLTVQSSAVVSIDSPRAVIKPAAGTTTVIFTVSLSTPSSAPVTVDFATQDGSAAAGTDYQAAQGSLTFTPGRTSQTVPVTILGGPANGSPKTFQVVLSRASGATIGTAVGTATISAGRVLTLKTTKPHLWANGHQDTTLRASLIDPQVGPVSGAAVTLSADVADGVTVDGAPLGSGIVAVTNAAGIATFSHVRSTRTGTVHFAVTAADPSQTLSAHVTVSFDRHKVVVQFMGITTSLQCTGTVCGSNDGSDRFGGLRGLMSAQGFQDTDFLFYSYRGGSVDLATGEWNANNYSCPDTAESYKVAIPQVTNLIQRFGQANPNTDFYLVGHSQGGMLAFQELGFLSTLPPTTAIKAVITLDSPLGGAPPAHALIAALDCWRGPAVAQIIREWYTTTVHQQQGTTARLLCGFLAVCTEPLPLRNQYMLAEAPGTQIITWGSTDDAVYVQGKCLSAKLSPPDNSSTEIIQGAGGGLEALGSSPPPKLTKAGIAACVSDSHARVIARHQGDIAALIGNQN